MKKNITVLLLFVLASCNPIGESVGETPLIENGISSINDINLKKGDKITFWNKVATRKDSSFAKYKIRYSISLDGKVVKYDSTYVSNGKHEINSKTKIEEIVHSSSTEKDSIEYVKNWEFEIKNNSFFTVPKDGNYNFDFKLYIPEMDFFEKNNSSTSIIIRKK
ncbi:hypothetical protein L1276_004481 [Flavobacterium sp. HSC-32F16]|uniref:hypothetical protein n=1 Tax=Flavobacterium sp. HSC-32F16 TaxID=2910964 RepID=UPI0020A5962D|nr:hypothetical protein [Flavobacterium sp. HSC-32F16]MCP2029297.1 hypothetical protein [Flavobacterium sp. HSC-32F16]